jgi:hypothetical protein
MNASKSRMRNGTALEDPVNETAKFRRKKIAKQTPGYTNAEASITALRGASPPKILNALADA